MVNLLTETLIEALEINSGFSIEFDTDQDKYDFILDLTNQFRTKLKSKNILIYTKEEVEMAFEAGSEFALVKNSPNFDRFISKLR